MNELTSLGHLRCQHMIKACQRRGVHVYEHQCSRAVNRNTQNRYCFQHLCKHVCHEEPRIVEQRIVEQGHNPNHCYVTIKARTGKPEHQCTRKAILGGMCSQHHRIHNQIHNRNQHIEEEHAQPH